MDNPMTRSQSDGLATLSISKFYSCFYTAEELKKVALELIKCCNHFGEDYHKHFMELFDKSGNVTRIIFLKYPSEDTKEIHDKLAIAISTRLSVSAHQFETHFCIKQQ